MKKVLLGLVVYLMFPFSNPAVFAGEGGSVKTEAKVESYISGVYRQIDFGKYNHLQYDAFDKAYHGYLNLKNAGKLNADKAIISVCDFSLPSTEKRLWIIDLRNKKVLYNTYVAHGQGSGADYARYFSNKANSHESALGFYVTEDTYQGKHGTSLRLEGMDKGFNDAAYDRGIVVHGADYVSDQFIKSTNRLGRSWGCPAVPSKLSLPIINTIKDRTCLFIYYPETKYLETGYWLNKQVNDLPGNKSFADNGAHSQGGQNSRG